MSPDAERIVLLRDGRAAALIGRSEAALRQATRLPTDQRNLAIDPAQTHAQPVSRLHAVNKRVRELAAGVNPDADFICECGCFQFVRLTIEEYDALNGALVYSDGHPPKPAA